MTVPLSRSFFNEQWQNIFDKKIDFLISIDKAKMKYAIVNL